MSEADWERFHEGEAVDVNLLGLSPMEVQLMVGNKQMRLQLRGGVSWVTHIPPKELLSASSPSPEGIGVYSLEQVQSLYQSANRGQLLSSLEQITLLHSFIVLAGESPQQKKQSPTDTTLAYLGADILGKKVSLRVSADLYGVHYPVGLLMEVISINARTGDVVLAYSPSGENGHIYKYPLTLPKESVARE